MNATTDKSTELKTIIEAIVSSHQEQILKQQEQIEQLNQLLDLQREYHTNLRNAIELPKYTHRVNLNLTASDISDRRGEVGTYYKLELSQLASRLGIVPDTKLSAATKNKAAWLKLMEQYIDPDGYQWQYPGLRVGFYHQPDLEIIGTKAIDCDFDVVSLN
jgi:hypothetical protein